MDILNWLRFKCYYALYKVVGTKFPWEACLLSKLMKIRFSLQSVDYSFEKKLLFNLCQHNSEIFITWNDVVTVSTHKKGY